MSMYKTHRKLDIVDILARAKRRTLKKMNCRDVVRNRDRFVRFPFDRILVPRCSKYPDFCRENSGENFHCFRKTLAKLSFLSRERQLWRAAPVDAFGTNARDLGDCERLTLLPLPSLIYWWLCLGLWTTQKPVKRVTWDAPPFPLDCFSVLYQVPLPPEAIYLIYRFFSMRRM